MKKIVFILAAAMTVFAVSCNKEPNGGGENGDKSKPVTKTISATLPNVKAALVGEIVLWEPGDAISVFDGKSNNKFTMEEGSRSGAKASFTGKVAGDAEQLVAVYPYVSSASFANGKVTGSIPSRQSPGTISFDTSCFAAVGQVDGDAVTLKSAVSFVKVTLGSSQSTKSISLSGNNGESVAGDFSVTADGATVTPEASGSSSSLCVGNFEGGKSYLLTTFGGIKLSSGLTVSVDLGGGYIATKKISSNVTINAGSVYAVDMADAEVTQISVSYKTESDTLTFNLGETKEVEVGGVNIAKIDFDPFGHTGWTTDASKSSTGKVSITAPSTLEGVDAAANLVIIGTASTGSTTTDTLLVRLAGINSKEDLVACRDAIVSKVEGATAPYMVDGWLTFNADVAISDEDMLDKSSGRYFFPVVSIPINGQNKTVTITSSYDASALAGTSYYSFIQWLKTDVKDLTLTGSMEIKNAPKKDIRCGALAGVFGAQGTDTEEIKMTVSNVKVAVNLTATNPVAGNSIRLAGFAAMVTGGNVNTIVTIKDCESAGIFTTTENVREVAGFFGTSGGGTPGSIVNITKCKFTGKVDYAQKANHGTLRIAGIVGSAERSTTISKCENSGTINVNAGGAALVSDTGGLAGICGRTNAQSGTNNMTYVIEDCVNSSTIKVDNALSGDKIQYIQQILATAKSQDNLTLSNNSENGTITINYAN